MTREQKTITPGQRLAEETNPALWNALKKETQAVYEAKAARLGIQPLEVEAKPPTDGELWEIAEGLWSSPKDRAKHFLRLVRERDGISAVPCCLCGGECREFSVENEVWNHVVRKNGKEHNDEYLCALCYAKAASDEIAKLLRERDGEPLPVTPEMFRNWEMDFRSQTEESLWGWYVAARINAHRGVREVPQVTGEMLRRASTFSSYRDAAEAVNKQLQRDAERWRECERLIRECPNDPEWCGIPVYGDDTFVGAVDDSIKRKEQT